MRPSPSLWLFAVQTAMATPDAPQACVRSRLRHRVTLGACSKGRTDVRKLGTKHPHRHAAQVVASMPRLARAVNASGTAICLGLLTAMMSLRPPSYRCSLKDLMKQMFP